MSIENVKNYFKQYGIESRILEFDTSSATVELAAKAAGCEPERIAKTLSFDINGSPALIVHIRRHEDRQPKIQAAVPHKGKNASGRNRRRTLWDTPWEAYVLLP